MAEKVYADPALPRIAGQQRPRTNAPAVTPHDYYKRNLFIPFLDHLLVKLDEMFSGLFTSLVSDMLSMVL